MTNIAIRVENLSKQYHIGQLHQRHDTLRDALSAGLGRFRRNSQPETHDKDDTIWALKDVSFEVKRGEVVGIIGRNGAGKSTLLKILTRITEPTRGRAELHGRVGSLLEVGTGFHPELTGRENIYMSGTILGMKKIEINRKFDEIVAFSGVEKFIDTPVKRYSSGMNVRLGFAVAAHLEPEILLVDEVLAVGDVAFQKKCLGKIGDVAKEGRTILLVSHNLPYIVHSCSRALLIENGKLVLDGKSHQVTELYSSNTQSDTDVSALSFDTSEKLVSKELSVPQVDILSETGDPLTTIAGGQTVRVRIHFHCKNVLVSTSFMVTFSTSTGIEILRLSTMPISGYYLPTLSGDGYVDCVVESMPFTGGVFSLGVGVGRPNVEYLVLDKNIGTFTISPYDAYESGFGVDRRCGVMVTSHHWELHQS